MDNNDKQINTENVIDLTKVDWNKLSIAEFHSLEKQLQEKHQLIKKANKARTPTPKSHGGFVLVKIRDNTYSIKDALFQRLKAIKSEKSREKLINEIISTHNVVESL